MFFYFFLFLILEYSLDRLFRQVRIAIDQLVREGLGRKGRRQRNTGFLPMKRYFSYIFFTYYMSYKRI